MNMGAGRIVYQDLTRIDKSIRDGDLFENAGAARRRWIAAPAAHTPCTSSACCPTAACTAASSTCTRSSRWPRAARCRACSCT